MTNEHEQPQRICLHACCGPCSLEPTRILREQGFEPTIYYANSNIHPAGEYDHRLQTLRTWAANNQVEVVEGTYDPQEWEASAGVVGDRTLAEAKAWRAEQTDSPQAEPQAADSTGRLVLDQLPNLRLARCRACYRLRFAETARWAREHGFAYLGTTLSVSPYQYTQVIQEELERAAAEQGLTPVFEDYRPYYDEATRRSRQLGMYRQNNCGCRISVLEAEAERAERKAQRKAARQAELAEHAQEREAEEQARAINRAQKQAYAAKQQNKRAILRALRAQQKADEERD